MVPSEPNSIDRAVAAHSEPNAELTPEEGAALEAFFAVLDERA